MTVKKCSSRRSPTPGRTRRDRRRHALREERCVDEGPTQKRFRPRAMGRATRVQARTSHITIVVDELKGRRRQQDRDRRRLGQKVTPVRISAGVIRTGFALVRRKGLREAAPRGPRIRTSSRSGCTTPASPRSRSSGRATSVKFIIHTARPGIVIGKKGAEIEKLKKELQKLTPKEVSINIRRSRSPRPTRSWWRRTSPCSSSGGWLSAGP